MDSAISANGRDQINANERSAGIISPHPLSLLGEVYTELDAINTDWNRRRYLPAAAAAEELVARNHFLQQTHHLLEEAATRNRIFGDVSLYTSTVDPVLEALARQWLVDNIGLLPSRTANNGSVDGTGTQSLQGYYPELIGENHDQRDQHWATIHNWHQTLTPNGIMESDNTPSGGPGEVYFQSPGDTHDIATTNWMRTHRLGISAPADNMDPQDIRSQRPTEGHEAAVGESHDPIDPEISTQPHPIAPSSAEDNYHMNRNITLSRDIFQYYDPQNDHETTHSQSFYNNIRPLNLRVDASQYRTHLRTPKPFEPFDPSEKDFVSQSPLSNIRNGTEGNTHINVKSQLHQTSLPTDLHGLPYASPAFEQVPGQNIGHGIEEKRYSNGRINYEWSPNDNEKRAVTPLNIDPALFMPHPHGDTRVLLPKPRYRVEDNPNMDVQYQRGIAFNHNNHQVQATPRSPAFGPSTRVQARRVHLANARNGAESNPWMNTQPASWVTFEDKQQLHSEPVATETGTNPPFAQTSFSKAPPLQAPFPQFTYDLAPNPYRNIHLPTTLPANTQAPLPQFTYGFAPNPYRNTQPPTSLTANTQAPFPQSTYGLTPNPYRNIRPPTSLTANTQAPFPRPTYGLAPNSEVPLPRFTHGLASNPWRNFRPRNDLGGYPNLDHAALMDITDRQNGDGSYIQGNDALIDFANRQHGDHGYTQGYDGRFNIASPVPNNNTQASQAVMELRGQVGGDNFEANAYNMVIERMDGRVLPNSRET